MYGIYNTEALEKFVDMVNHMHNITMPNQKPICRPTWHITASTYICKYARHTTIFNKFVIIFMKHKGKICCHVQGIYNTVTYICGSYQNLGERLSTNFTCNSIKTERNLNAVKTTIRKTNPDYDIVINRLHLYYDMKLATFSMDRDKNLIIQ